ncbi:MAG: alpha/beta hydrolase [Myxococcales bacterium]|nr:alpha/beta hydrolase [Myxococcales bacterium]
MPTFPPGRLFELPDQSLCVHEDGTGPAVVLCHGFPELAYSWRHQLNALARGGFRAIAPDQRGYGESGAPRTVEAYDLAHLTGDLVFLLDALEIERAVFAGHDWGGFVAWAMPLLYPERCLGVIGVNTPYVPFPTTDLLRAAFPDPEKLYILWFQEPGIAESVLEREPRLVFEKLMRRGTPPAESLVETGDANPFRRLAELEDLGEPLLSEEEIEIYARGFEKSGFFGPVSWYRNIDRNKELVPEIGVRKLDLPCLQIGAAWDRALPPELASGMPALCSDLEMHTIEACGHWTQQEKPEELSGLMLDWLRRRFS